jgi:hypothetical protein
MMRRAIAGLAMVAACVAAAPGAAAAQAPPPPPPVQGATRATRVRVNTNLANVRPQGRLAFASPDSLVVVDEYGHATRILRGNITSVDTSAGRFRHPWQGLGIGILAGGAAGMAIGFAAGDDPPGFMSMTASENAVLGGAVLGTLGGIAGLVAGSLIRTDRWHRTALDRLTVAVTPVHAGGFSVSFSMPVGRGSVAPGRLH